MDPDLSRLIDNVQHCGNSLKNVTDQAVGAMMALKSASLKAEANFRLQKENADNEIAQLQKDIAALRQEQLKATRELKAIQRQIEQERAEIGREKQRFPPDDAGH